MVLNEVGCLMLTNVFWVNFWWCVGVASPLEQSHLDLLAFLLQKLNRVYHLHFQVVRHIAMQVQLFQVSLHLVQKLDLRLVVLHQLFVLYFRLLHRRLLPFQKAIVIPVSRITQVRLVERSFQNKIRLRQLICILTVLALG